MSERHNHSSTAQGTCARRVSAAVTKRRVEASIAHRLLFDLAFLAFDGPKNEFAAGADIFLNLCVSSMRECSTAMRSKLEAPTNPTQPVCWLTYAASSGVEIGPP